jgi:hypothetical protein
MAKYSDMKRVNKMGMTELFLQASQLSDDKVALMQTECRDVNAIKQKKSKTDILVSRVHRNYEEINRRMVTESEQAIANISK